LTISITPVLIKESTVFPIRLRVNPMIRYRLIDASLLFQFSAVCTMTTAELLEREITPGYVK
jgi:hypothetical protein